jgi:hypothetical protein
MLGAAVAFAAILGATTPAFAESGAVLRGLDKVTGQARDFTAPINRPVKFGTLEITVKACQKAAPEDTPEVSVYLQVIDHPVARLKGQVPPATPIKNGWVFASSPGLNGLEHPTYDLWAIDCKA